MSVDRMTEKSAAAVTAAQRIAEDHHNQQLEPEHLLRALLAQTDGVVQPVLLGAGANLERMTQLADEAIGRRPEVRGPNVELRAGPAPFCFSHRKRTVGKRSCRRSGGLGELLSTTSISASPMSFSINSLRHRSSRSTSL